MQNRQFYLLDSLSSHTNPHLPKAVPNGDLRPKQKPSLGPPRHGLQGFWSEFLVWCELSALTDKWHFYSYSTIVPWVCRALGISEGLLGVWLARLDLGILGRYLPCRHSINVPLQPYPAFKTIAQKNVVFRCLSQKIFQRSEEVLGIP